MLGPESKHMQYTLGTTHIPSLITWILWISGIHGVIMHRKNKVVARVGLRGV